MRRWVWLLIAASLALAACIESGSVSTGSQATSRHSTPVVSSTTISENGRTLKIVGCDDPSKDARVLCETYQLIHDNYVDPVSDEILAKGAADGLALLDGATANGPIVCVAPSEDFVDACATVPIQAEDSHEAVQAMLVGMAGLALDPHSAYLDPDLLAMVNDEQDGRVEGIGALVIAEDRSGSEVAHCSLLSETCRLFIVSTIQGGPAEAAGVLRNDVVVAVGGVDVDGKSIEEVTRTVRGPAGTDVHLKILRGTNTLDVTITRAAVEVPVISSARFGPAGYVRLNQFTETADTQLEKAIFDLLTHDISTIILDLRDDPGGLLTTAIGVASEFLPDGEVVETRSPESTRTYDVSGNMIVPRDVRVIVVVNRGSASASELVAALLQERGRAELVGENTYGKNTVQQQFPLSDGGALKLTIARWVTPGGLDFGGVGVTPDVSGDFPSELTPKEVVDLALSITAQVQ